jgi:hypothetical protein
MMNDVGRAMREKEDERRLGLRPEPELPIGAGGSIPASPPTHLIDRALYDRITNQLLDHRRELLEACKSAIAFVTGEYAEAIAMRNQLRAAIAAVESE